MPVRNPVFVPDFLLFCIFEQHDKLKILIE